MVGGLATVAVLGAAVAESGALACLLAGASAGAVSGNLAGGSGGSSSLGRCSLSGGSSLGGGGSLGGRGDSAVAAAVTEGRVAASSAVVSLWTCQ